MSKFQNVKVGDQVRLPLTLDKGFKMLTGTVIWIHPERRFFQVEFQLPGGTVRESYSFYGEMPNERKEG